MQTVAEGARANFAPSGSVDNPERILRREPNGAGVPRPTFRFFDGESPPEGACRKQKTKKNLKKHGGQILFVSSAQVSRRRSGWRAMQYGRKYSRTVRGLLYANSVLLLAGVSNLHTIASRISAVTRAEAALVCPELAEEDALELLRGTEEDDPPPGPSGGVMRLLK